MTGPRNRRAYADGQEVREAVKAIMADHPPLAWPLTAKDINPRLPPDLRRHDDTIRWHMRKIHEAHDGIADAFAPHEFIT